MAFAQFPCDTRSACIAVLNTPEDPKVAVEKCRSVGAPIVLTCHDDHLLWWKQGRTCAEFVEPVRRENIASFFESHREDFSPTAIYRAKTLGRIKYDYQLRFVDLGLMSLVEEEVGEALGNLIARNVASLKKRLDWSEVTDEQGHWLLQSVFWLVSAKILHDKDVAAFINADLEDISSTFAALASHYGSKIPALTRSQVEALRDCAADIKRFAHLGLTTTESLAYVYENTLISKETRTKLGTHSTPSFLIDYMIGQLSDWISEIPENDRSVFEPACGHAGFLVAAMRLLTQLLPEEKSIASRRGAYLRARLHGMEIDSFALELARLSLTLSDIPNPDGWDLRRGDMFKDKSLEEQAEKSSILLANPPFANFSPEDKQSYNKSDLRFDNRTAEVMWRTIPRLPPGGVFAFVMPQTLLHAKNATELRKYLLQQCEIKEICLFPDKVFNFSDAESAIVIGRVNPGVSLTSSTVKYRHIRENQLARFQASSNETHVDIKPQKELFASKNHSLRVPEFADIWNKLSVRCIDDIATLGQGLFFKGEDLPNGITTYSTEKFVNAAPGFIRFDCKYLHELPTKYWLNLSDEAIDRAVTGCEIGTPQILLNYARTSRGPWRLKALLDREGNAVASRFVTVRLKVDSWSLEALWAILNSPIANCFAYSHLSKRDNLVGILRKIPIPEKSPPVQLTKLVEKYLELATANASSSVLRDQILGIDALVLSLYNLPPGSHRQLLMTFNEEERPGVPFSHVRYFPKEFQFPLSFNVFHEYESDWKKANKRRGELIKKESSNTLSSVEQEELDGLQAYADYFLDREAPPDYCMLNELIRQQASHRPDGGKTT